MSQNILFKSLSIYSFINFQRNKDNISTSYKKLQYRSMLIVEWKDKKVST